MWWRFKSPSPADELLMEFAGVKHLQERPGAAEFSGRCQASAQHFSAINAKMYSVIFLKLTRRVSEYFFAAELASDD